MACFHVQGCVSCHSLNQRKEEEAVKHQKVVSDLQDQLEDLIIEKCIVNSKSDLSENINDPCRRSELIRMYQYLQTQIWAWTKDAINTFESSERNTNLAKNLIKETFEKGTKDMILKRGEMDGMFQQNGMPSPIKEKISPYIQSSMKNLQIIFFLHFKNIKTPSDFKTFVEEKHLHLHKFLHEQKNPSLSEVDHEPKNPSFHEGFNGQKNPSLHKGFHEQKNPSLHKGFNEKKNPSFHKGFNEQKNPSLHKGFNEQKNPSFHEGFHEQKNPSFHEGFNEQKNPSLHKGFNEKKNPSFHEGFHEQKSPSLEEVFNKLYVHCYYVSRMMALHNPPIKLCWDRAGVDVFPDLEMDVSH